MVWWIVQTVVASAWIWCLHPNSAGMSSNPSYITIFLSSSEYADVVELYALLQAEEDVNLKTYFFFHCYVYHTK